MRGFGHFPTLSSPISKYEREYKKTFDEDLKLAILSEVAPKTLAPQIAMHSAHLTTYKTLREFIVQYLKSKNLWKRGAGTAFGTQSASPGAPYSGPAPMEIGAVDADNKSKPKGDRGGKGDKKGKPGKGPKGASSRKVMVRVRIRARPRPAMPTPPRDLRVQFVVPTRGKTTPLKRATSTPVAFRKETARASGRRHQVRRT